jgi:transposase
LIVLNLGSNPISIGSDTMAFPGEVLLSTNLDRTGETVSGDLGLRGVPCLVGIEACASSHHWSREIQALGHTVRLMPPAYVLRQATEE